MKFPFLIVLISITSIDTYAERQNRSERYSDEYKKYQHAKSPIKQDQIKHFVYFERGRDRIHNHPFIDNPRFLGAQIMYSWAQLEPSYGKYDFSIISEDYEYLRSKGKKLFIQLQDATFTVTYKGVPKYLRTENYDGGVTAQRSDDGHPEGWVAKRWNAQVQERFALLLAALGKQFDGKIEGINLQESAIHVTSEHDPSFSPSLYVSALKMNMLALKKAFPNSTTMQYANFMPGEWLPWDDKGYLRSIYQHGEDIGVGLGAPDLMPQKKPQLNHALAMMHESEFSVPLGIAVQDGNYIGMTGMGTSNIVQNERTNIVPMLHGFAKHFLRVQYMFWVDQEPYFSEDVIPSFQ